MNHIKKAGPCALAILLLAGCASIKDSSENEEILSDREQKAVLANTKMPQNYGFAAYRVSDGIGIQGQTRLHANHLAKAKLLKGSIPVIEMRGRSPRMKMNALLDLSSPASWMEFNTSQDFNAVFLGIDDQNVPYRGGYNTGGAPGYAAVVSQLRIDQLFMEDTPLYVRMAMNSLGPLTRGIKVPAVDAIIGYDVLKHFEYVQFDFDSEVVKFSSSIPYIPHQDLLMTSAKIKPLKNFGLAVEGAIFGETTPIILDIAGDYHFARGDVKVNITKQVSIGDVVYRKVPTLLLPQNSSPPRAGRKMLEKYIVTVCGKAGVVHFERIPE
jgi:hypothetical protein